MRNLLFASALFSLVAACGDGTGTRISENPGPDAAVEPTAVPGTELAACRFEVPSSLGWTEGVEYQCGELNVYENRADERGRVIKLHYIQITGAQNGIATIYLDGGPGGDGSRMVPRLAELDPALREGLLSQGDFLVISQRGTNLSSPSLICGQQQAPSACAAQLSADADLPMYNTASNADDIDDLRAALGYDQLNLYGISYGSRLALEVLRRHGDNVRAAVAGGTVPAHVVWPAETPASFHGAILALGASCTADTACEAAYGDVAQAFLDAVVDMNSDPVNVEVFGQQFPLDGNTFAAAVFQLMYSKASYSFLPLVITDLRDRRTDRVTDIILEAFGSQQGGNPIADGMYLSVVCGELFNPGPKTAAFENAVVGVPDAILGSTGGNWQQLVNSCSSWPLGEVQPELTALVESDVPTLLSNGNLDPITPPRFGDAAATGLSNAQIVAFANSGHGATLQTSCGIQVLNDFLASPDQPVDASCAANITTEYQLPAAARDALAQQRARISSELRAMPAPLWIGKVLRDWGPR